MKKDRRVKTSFFTLDDVQRQYLAGFLDAEGSILLDTSQKGGAPLRIVMTNTDQAVIRRIFEWLGFGGIYEQKLRPGHFGRKIVYIWGNYSAQPNRRLLEFLGPYLRVKRMKAENIMETTFDVAPMSWPYIAGFTDGEGYVEYRAQKGQYRFGIIQKDDTILKEIQCFIGFGKLQAGACSTLVLQRHNDQLSFAKAILPYSVVKKAKLEAAVDFIESKQWNLGKKLMRVDGGILVQKYQNGMSTWKLAAEYGVRQPSMHRKLRTLGVTFRHQSRSCKIVPPRMNPMPTVNLCRSVSG